MNAPKEIVKARKEEARYRELLSEIEEIEFLIPEVESDSSDMYVNDAASAETDALPMPLSLQQEIAEAVVGILRRKLVSLRAETDQLRTALDMPK